MVSRAGKVASKKGKGKEGRYEHYWNISDVETGHIASHDTQQFDEITLVPQHEEENQQEDEVFAVNVPRYWHGEKKCLEAKLVELERFDEFDAYEEVADEGQKTLGTSWVLTEKIKAGKNIVKARLCVRGDQEDTENIQTDSPTIRKSNINILLMLASRNKWTIGSQDVTSAFLQSVQISRDVFVKPPLERRIKGMIWKLNKTVYGLVDASRGFYLNFSRELLERGASSPGWIRPCSSTSMESRTSTTENLMELQSHM